MNPRKIKRIVTGHPAVDGAGVRLVRVIGHETVRDFDPFLMLDAFDSVDPADYVKGFPWHPHRGIETVTYLIRGDIEHGDSLGNKGSILDGGCQWMTAGGGIIHQEMPRASERMLGLQLWLNLPAKDKMTDPAYRDLTAEKIPVVNGEGSRVAVIAGAYQGTAGAMRADYVDATMLDVSLEPGAGVNVSLPASVTAFVYVIDGSLSFDAACDAIPDAAAVGVPAANAAPRAFHDRRRAVLLTDGDAVCLTAPDSSSARCVLFYGAPLKEPVAWGGPIVMNTQAELDQAYRDLDENTFINKNSRGT